MALLAAGFIGEGQGQAAVDPIDIEGDGADGRQQGQGDKELGQVGRGVRLVENQKVGCEWGSPIRSNPLLPHPPQRPLQYRIGQIHPAVAQALQNRTGGSETTGLLGREHQPDGAAQ